jgi:hypothetical protein
VSRDVAHLRRFACVLAVFAAAARPMCAEPRIQLKIPAFDVGFANFTSVVLPGHDYGGLELWIEDANAEMQLSTVRVTLNEIPMTPFVGINPLPRGVRIIVKLGATLNPEYSLKASGENIIAISAADTSKVTYAGRFYLTLDPDTTAPHAVARARVTQHEVSAPPVRRPPRVEFMSAWPERTAEDMLTLSAEVSDGEGLRRIVIEVNGNDVEQIDLENERPVRRRDGFSISSKVPGTVTGDGRRVIISVPVKLRKDINIVAVRAENAIGLHTRSDRVVVRR